MIELRISVDSDDGGQGLLSLHQWLRQDEELSGRSTIKLESGAAATGHMGAVLDVINIVVGDGVAIGGLIIAYLSWRDSRHSQPNARIEVNAVIITLAANEAVDVDSLAEAIRKTAGA
jgi:hypothetical protein